MTTDKQAASLPCPLCGGNPLVVDCLDAGYAIQCGNDECPVGMCVCVDCYGETEEVSKRWNTRQALTAPDTQKPAGDAAEWIKAQPSETYDGLKIQFIALKTMVNTMGQQISHYSKKDYSTGEKRLAELEASLESERAMNAKLTEELSALTGDCGGGAFDHRALDALKNHQHQLDMDGIMVGVSRQAVDMAVEFIEKALTADNAKRGE